MDLGAGILNMAMRSALWGQHYVCVRWLRTLRAKALVLMRSVSFSRWLGKAAEMWRWVLKFVT